MKPPPPPAWIMQPPPDWQTPLNGITSTLRERLITMQTTGRNSRSILMSSADRAAHIDGQPLRNYCEQAHALPAESNACIIKPSNPFTNVCWVSVLTTFSAPPQILAASMLSCPPRNEEMMGDGFPFARCCRFVFEQ